MRTPNCRRALGLLLLDWSLECSTTPLVLSGPDGRHCLSRESLALVRAGHINRTKCTKIHTSRELPALFNLEYVRVKVTAPNAPNAEEKMASENGV